MTNRNCNLYYEINPEASRQQAGGPKGYIEHSALRPRILLLLKEKPLWAYTLCMSEWFLYIAESRKGKYYVGITTEPARRIKEHNNGRGSQMAKIEGPFELKYVSQAMPNQSEARKREMQVKRWTRDQKEKLVRGDLD